MPRRRSSAARPRPQATRTYSEAHQKDPQFFELLRTLEAYKKIFDEKTTILLSGDSELLKYLSHGFLPGGTQRSTPLQGVPPGHTQPPTPLQSVPPAECATSILSTMHRRATSDHRHDHGPPHEHGRPGGTRRRRTAQVWLWLLAALTAWAATGIYVVQPNQRAVVWRCGRILPEPSLPGIHCGLPWGIDRVTRLKVYEQKRVGVGL